MYKQFDIKNMTLGVPQWLSHLSIYLSLAQVKITRSWD